MTLLHFHTPFVLRANIGPHEVPENEGFFVCDDGAVILDTANKIIIVIENEDQESMANARLVIPLSNVKNIKCKRFRSTGGNYSGGQVCFHGRFDRAMEEKITLKMETSTFAMLTRALKDLLEGWRLKTFKCLQ